MRKNRRDSLKKERIIMVTSSAFVLAALTMTGLYLRGQEAKEQDDGYTLDFTALENTADKKYQQIQDSQLDKVDQDIALAENFNMENDLDYMPMEEAGSRLIQIEGLTENATQESMTGMGGSVLQKEDDKNLTKKTEEKGKTDTDKDDKEKNDNRNDKDKAAENNVNLLESEQPLQESQITEQQDPEVQETAARDLHFSEGENMIRPVSGDIILPYSMNGSVYFETLAQYKYNPATVFFAEEGAAAIACAEGRVINIFDDSEIGKAVTLDLGDGYTATYGQLSGVRVNVNDYVDAGQVLATVAPPTKYYSLEGSNLYFKLEKNGDPVNPEGLF